MTMMGMCFPNAHAAPRPMVVELYTSQGCINCPEADAVLKQLRDNPNILALSFHVHYWDRMGWKDPWSSEFNTARQRAYQQTLGLSTVYTPQMIIEGRSSVIGSDREAIKQAITHDKKDMPDLPITLTPDANNLVIDIPAAAPGVSIPDTATAWEIHFDRNATTAVKAGENKGATLENINNVTRFMRMDFHPGQENKYELPMAEWPEDAVAILVQDKPTGRVLGAAVYVRPGKS
jgi:hypothetical protein